MKLQNSILFIGGISVAYFAFKWYSSNDPSYEPWVTFLSSSVTALAYYFSLKNNTKEKSNESKRESITLKGDENIVIKNSKNSKININK